MCLAQEHNTVALVRLEPRPLGLRSQTAGYAAWLFIRGICTYVINTEITCADPSVLLNLIYSLENSIGHDVCNCDCIP